MPAPPIPKEAGSVKNFDRCGLAAPSIPVSDLGEPFRFGGTDPGGGRGQLLFGVKQIGASLATPTEVRRHLRRNRLFVQRPAARNRVGFRPSRTLN
jgi:hypothetical protein